MCETLFHSFEAAFAYMRTAVKLSPNYYLQVKLHFLSMFSCRLYFCILLLILLCFSLSGSLRWDVMEASRVDMISQRVVIIVSEMRGCCRSWWNILLITHKHTPSAVCLFEEFMT